MSRRSHRATEVAREGTDIGALANREGHGPNKRFTLGADTDELRLMDGDRPSFELDLLPSPRTRVRAHAIDGDGRKCRRHLHLIAEHPLEDAVGEVFIPKLRRDGGFAGDIAFCIIGRSLRPEGYLGKVALGVEREHAQKARRLPHTDYKHARCHRVERARVTHPTLAHAAPYARDDVM